MKSHPNSSIRFIFALLIWGSVISLPTALFAADVSYSLGAGAAYVPDYEGSDDMTGAPALFFNAQWERGYFVKLVGTAVRANVLPNKQWSVGPVLQYRASRDDDVDNTSVSRMQKIDSTVEGGIFAGFNHADWDVSLQWVKDLSDEHDGSLAKLMAGYSIQKGKYTTRIGISSSYADDDYMDTYFSVNAANVGGSGLPFYTAESGIKDVGADLTVRYQITDKWDLMGLLGYTALLGDAKDSPLVDQEGDSGQMSLGLLAIYKF